MVHPVLDGFKKAGYDDSARHWITAGEESDGSTSRSGTEDIRGATVDP